MTSSLECPPLPGLMKQSQVHVYVCVYTFESCGNQGPHYINFVHLKSCLMSVYDEICSEKKTKKQKQKKNFM